MGDCARCCRFRNTLAALIAAVTILTILAGLGVQIAPLIAGAGIFGVALGFGSQTLVKDVLSGIFYTYRRYSHVTVSWGSLVFREATCGRLKDRLEHAIDNK